MEARSLSKCGTLTGWSVFQILGTNQHHIIAHAYAYGFDVITQELASFNYDKKTKTGRAITKTGVLYLLQGRPLFLNPKGHPQLREFSELHHCQIQFIKV